MSENRQKLIHLHSSVEKIPQAADLNYGEIAVQYAASSPILYIKNSSDGIVKFIDSGAIATILGSYVTNDTLTGSYATSADTVDAINAVATKLTNVYTYKGSRENYSDLPSTGLTVGDVYNVENANGNIPPGTNYAWNGTDWDSLGGSVDLSNYATTASVNTLSGYIDTISASTVDLLTSAHTHSNKSVLDGITSEKVSNWDGAYSTVTAHTGDTDIHVTTAQTAAWNAKQDAIEDLSDIRANAESGASAYEAVTAHTGNTDVHVTAGDKEKWNASAHNHTNKALLDTYTQTESDLADAVSKKHNHSNSAVLDTITTAKTEGWDNAAASAHNHTNKAVLDDIDSTKVSNWDSAYNAVTAHTGNTNIHVTTAQTAQWDSAYTISQTALVGIESGKDRGASVNANNELDLSGIYIDCGEY